MGVLPMLVALHAMAAEPPAPTPADPQTLLLLTSGSPGDEAETLREQVAVYTHDLGYEVRLLRGALPPAGAVGVAEVVALVRDERARLAFWCDVPGRDGRVTLHIVDASGVVGRRLIQTSDRDPTELHRAVGLKLRAVLSGTAPVDAPAEAPVPATDRPPPPATNPDDSSAAPSSSSVPQIARADRGTPTSNSWGSRLSATVGYELALPTGLASARHALALEGRMAIGWRGELAIGTALSGRATGSAGNGEVSLLDLPARVGARVLARWDRFAVGVGLVTGADLLAATARSSDGRQATSTSFAGAAGLEVLTRARLSRVIGCELRVFGEVPVPPTRFWVEGVPALDAGPRVGLRVGLSFPNL